MHYPVGPLRTYGRIPFGVLVQDRSLSESAPGLYVARPEAPPPGRYDVAVRLPTLNLVQCFEAMVEPAPAGAGAAPPAPAARRPVVEALFEDARLAPDAGPVTLRFALREPGSDRPVTGLHDVEVAVSESTGNGRRLVRLAETDPGIYAAAIRLRTPGRYIVELRAASRRLGFRDSPARQFEVLDEAAAKGEGAQP
jgi:hypothetical protein